MSARTFCVPGKPSPKARARTMRSGITFTPKPTQLAEGKVLECYLAAYRDAPAIEGPISLSIFIQFAVPASWSKKKKSEAFFHVSRPDTDNIIKLVTDALNGVAWNDDSQVCVLYARKVYGDEGISVKIEELA